MRLKQFYYLQTIARNNSFKKASEELFISHQALSYAMKKLEEEYQVTLFHRTPAGVTLTEEGEEFLKLANEILAIHDRMLDNFPKRNKVDLGGKLTIVAPGKYVNFFLPDILYQMDQQHPEIEIEVVRRGSTTIVAEMKEHAYEFGIIADISLNGTHLGNLDEDFLFVPLMQHHYMVGLSKKHPLSKAEKVSLKDLTNETFAFVDTNISNDINQNAFYQILKENGIHNVYIGASLLTQRFVNDGKMICLCDELELKYMIPQYHNMVGVELEEQIYATSGYIVHKSNLDNPRVQALMKMMDRFRQSNGWK